MKPSNAPNSAIPIPPPRGPFPTEQLEQIAGIRTEIDHDNAVNRNNFDAACAAWKIANLHSREYQLPLRDKPEPFSPQLFVTGADTEKDSGVVWIWIEQGAPVVCPDLPRLPVMPADDNIHIGPFFYGHFWHAGEDNRFNDDTKEIPGKSDDGVTGVWRFVGSAMSKGRGWYEKVG